MRLLSLLVFLLLFGGIVQAHDPGLSSIEMRLEKECVEVQMIFARKEIESLLQPRWNVEAKATTQPEATVPRWDKVAYGALEVHLDKRVATPKVEAILPDGSGGIQFTLRYPAQSNSRLSVRSLILSSLPRGHRQFVCVKDRDGNILSERMLAAKVNVFTMDLAAVSRSRSLSGWQFVVLGIKHILTGYDHLLFLFALLLAGGSLIEVSKIVTSFTVAHSITLAVATVNLVQIPSSVVEPLIAASIVYVGIENILRANLRRRWLLTFGFGLIHGFGFSSVLRQLGIGSNGTGILIPLFSFNLGVELGQGAIVFLVLPLVWQLRKQPAFVIRCVPSCSLLVTLAGAFWFLQRTV